MQVPLLDLKAQYATIKDRVISGLSIATILGFIVGLINSIYYVITNRYVQYRMFRLLALTLQKNLNGMIILCVAVSLILYIFWFLAVERMKCDRSKVIRFVVMIFLFLVALLFINWFLKSFAQLTLLSILRKLVINIKNFLNGKIPFNHLLNLLKEYIVIIIILLISGIIGVVCLYRVPALLLQKLKWGKISKTVKINYIRKAAFILFVLVVILNVGLITDSKTNTPEGPNIILLVVDTLRADSLGCYNQDSNDTPNIDRFAKNAIIFKNSIAQSPTTINSAPCIFCSVYPYEHGYFNYNCIIPYKLNSLAESLRNEGYQTFGISTNPHVTSRNRLEQGFDTFIEEYTWKNTDCNKVNDRFIKWLNNKTKPFFAMLWYIDPHVPYDPPREYIDKYILKEEERKLISDKTKMPGKWKAFDYKHISPAEKKVSKKLYDAEVNFFDAEFAKLINYLKQCDLMKNSIIILTSDHGESFWEKKNPLEKQTYGHGTSLYEEQIKIPLIISLPDQQQGKVILERAQHVDIVPTVLEYAKISGKTVDNLPSRGNSLKGVIDGAELKRKYFFSQLILDKTMPYYMECVQAGDFKLISSKQYGKVRFEPSRLQLFSLSSGESEIGVTNKNEKHQFTKLEKRLLTWEGSLEKVELTTKPVKYKSKEEEDKFLERLKSLGYLE